ncbi:MAG: aspartoacylase [Cyanobium sp. M30B3]|nr:MAG: aspartoacylase [Cyanobium sp. M30B3]
MDSQPQAAAVLVVAGTHGNERNAPWLLQHWQRHPGSLASAGLQLELVLGNPAAHARNQRYLERDLNRSFRPDLLADPQAQGPDLERARQLLAHHGPAGQHPCAVAFDLHSTTSAMGNSLVLYGRRPADLALAAALQARLGLPIYLHEGDPSQTGFLVERWPCGLVIEVGPVPQGVIQAPICRHTQLGLEAALAVLAEARQGRMRLPRSLLVHRHLGSLDLPRAGDGTPLACLHPQRQHRDWRPIRPGDPLFLEPGGAVIPYRPSAALEAQAARGEVVPVFINEAAYGEKGIALSLTQREVVMSQASWADALISLATRLRLAADQGRGGPL